MPGTVGRLKTDGGERNDVGSELICALVWVGFMQRRASRGKRSWCQQSAVREAGTCSELCRDDGLGRAI